MAINTARKISTKTEIEPAQAAPVLKTTNPVPEIESNPFYQVHFVSKESPEVKQKALTELLVAANIKAFEDFKAWLSFQRREMNTELMRLTNTEVFSNLQKVVEDMEKGILLYEQEMLPLADLLDSINALQSNGRITDAYREIEQDRADEKSLEAFRAEKAAEIAKLRDRATELRDSNFTVRDKASLWQKLTKAPQATIDRNNLELDELQKKVEQLETEITTREQTSLEKKSQLGEFTKDKERLRAMLDLSSDQIKQRHKAMVETAINFVKVNDERLSATREDQIKQLNLTANLEDANNSITMVYANLTDALTDANKEVIKKRDSLVIVPEGETASQKIVREQAIREIDRQLEKLSSSSKDTLGGLSELTAEGIQVQSMRQANEQQTSLVDALYTRGIASVASSLNVNLQSLGITALAQTASLAKGAMQRVQDLTAEVAQRQVVQNAIRMEDDIAEMQRAVVNIKAMGEAVTESTEIARKALTETKTKMAELAQIVDSVAQSRKDASGVTAEVMRDNPKVTPIRPEVAKTPFKFGSN